MLRLLLAFQLALSSLYLVYAVFITDACWTTPCLSSDFTINVLRVSVSASVSSVVFGALNVLLPVAGLYMLWRRVKTSYYAGLYNGAVAVNALLALLQCITWGEQYTDLLDLNSTDILMYGSQYALNARLRVNAMAMSTMCGMLAVVGSILSLALMCVLRGMSPVSFCRHSAVDSRRPASLVPATAPSPPPRHHSPVSAAWSCQADA